MLKDMEGFIRMAKEPPNILDEMTNEAHKKATYEARQKWVDLISQAHIRLSRGKLCDYAQELASWVMISATNEDLRMFCISLEEEMGV